MQTFCCSLVGAWARAIFKNSASRIFLGGRIYLNGNRRSYPAGFLSPAAAPAPGEFASFFRLENKRGVQWTREKDYGGGLNSTAVSKKLILIIISVYNVE